VRSELRAVHRAKSGCQKVLLAARPHHNHHAHWHHPRCSIAFALLSRPKFIRLPAGSNPRLIGGLPPGLSGAIPSKRKFLPSLYSREFFSHVPVQPGVRPLTDNQNGRRQQLPDVSQATADAPIQFSFGARRHASTGPRRLFVPQKPLMSPVFASEVMHPQTILKAATAAS
jgi:hypothetical protein